MTKTEAMTKITGQVAAGKNERELMWVYQLFKTGVLKLMDIEAAVKAGKAAKVKRGK